MNSLPLSEVYMSAWFHLGCIIAFVCGCIWAGILFPFIRWDYIKAEHYCEALNRILKSEAEKRHNYISEFDGEFWADNINTILFNHNPRSKWRIRFIFGKFEVVKAL